MGIATETELPALLDHLNFLSALAYDGPGIAAHKGIAAKVFSAFNGFEKKGFTVSGKGSREKPIIIRAETVGGVDMKVGVSLKGEFITP